MAARGQTRRPAHFRPETAPRSRFDRFLRPVPGLLSEAGPGPDGFRGYSPEKRRKERSKGPTEFPATSRVDARGTHPKTPLPHSGSMLCRHLRSGRLPEPVARSLLSNVAIAGAPSASPGRSRSRSPSHARRAARPVRGRCAICPSATGMGV